MAPRRHRADTSALAPAPDVLELLRGLRRRGVPPGLLHLRPEPGKLIQGGIARESMPHQVAARHRARTPDAAPAMDVNRPAILDASVDLVQDSDHDFRSFRNL